MVKTLPTGLIGYGRQTGQETAPWGPGQRTCCILHYIVRGRGVFQRSGIRYTLGAGQSFIIRAFEEIYYAPDPDDPWEYIWINVYGEPYTRRLGQIHAQDGCILPPLAPEHILPLFSFLASLGTGQSHAADALALAILGVYADRFPLPEAQNRSADRFDTATLLIRAGFHRPDFNIASLCESLHVSRATLHRCFIRRCGLSPGAYLTRTRLACAEELLNRGSSVKATALSCGFTDPLYFSRVYRAVKGVPPSAVCSTDQTANRKSYTPAQP